MTTENDTKTMDRIWKMTLKNDMKAMLELTLKNDYRQTKMTHNNRNHPGI